MAERCPMKSRSRRDKENEIFSELSSLLPEDLLQDTKPDKLSVLRLTLAYMKCRNNLRTDAPDLTECLASDSEADVYPPRAATPPLAMLDNDGNVVAGTLVSHRNVVRDSDISLPESVLSKLEQAFLCEDPGSLVVDVEQRYEKLQKYKEGLERGMKEFLGQTFGDAPENKTRDVSSARQKSAKRPLKNSADEENSEKILEYGLPVQRCGQMSPISEEANLMLEALPGLFLILDKNKRVLFISHNVGRLLGFSQSNIIGQDISEFIFDKDYHEIERQMCDEQFQGDRSKGVQSRSLSRTFYLAMKFCFQKPSSRQKNCGYKLFRWNAKLRLHRDKPGGDIKVKSLLSLCRPVRDDVVPELQRSESMFYSKHTMNYKCVYCDPRVEEILGYSPNKILDTDGFQLKHPCDVLMCRYKHKSVVVQGKGDSGYYRLLAKNGRWQWALSQYTVVYDRAGQPLYVDVYTSTISVEEAQCVLSREKKDYDRMKAQGFDFDLASCGLAKPTLATIAAGRQLKKQKLGHDFTSVSVSFKRTPSGFRPNTSCDNSSSLSSVSSFSSESSGPPSIADLTPVNVTTERWRSCDENTCNLVEMMHPPTSDVVNNHQGYQVDTMSKSSPDSGIDAGSDSEIYNMTLPQPNINRAEQTSDFSFLQELLDDGNNNMKHGTKTRNEDKIFCNEKETEWMNLPDACGTTVLSLSHKVSSVLDQTDVGDELDFNITSIASEDLSSPLLDIDFLLSDVDVPCSPWNLPSIPELQSQPLNQPAPQCPLLTVPLTPTTQSLPLSLPSSLTTQSQPLNLPSSPSQQSPSCADFEIQSILNFFVPDKTSEKLFPKSLTPIPESPLCVSLPAPACDGTPFTEQSISVSTTSNTNDVSLLSTTSNFSHSGKVDTFTKPNQHGGLNVHQRTMDLTVGQVPATTFLTAADDTEIRPFKCPDLIYEISQSIRNEQYPQRSADDLYKKHSKLEQASSENPNDFRTFHTHGVQDLSASIGGSSEVVIGTADKRNNQYDVSSTKFSTRKKLRGSAVAPNSKQQTDACTRRRLHESIISLENDLSTLNSIEIDKSELSLGESLQQTNSNFGSSIRMRTNLETSPCCNPQVRKTLCSQYMEFETVLNRLFLERPSQKSRNHHFNQVVPHGMPTSLCAGSHSSNHTSGTHADLASVRASELAPLQTDDPDLSYFLKQLDSGGACVNEATNKIPIHSQQTASCAAGSTSYQTTQPTATNLTVADDLQDLDLDFSTIESELTRCGVELSDYI